MNRPPSGSMVYWRFKSNVRSDQHGFIFGYVTYVSGPNMIRMGRWNGDSVGGVVVDCADIEWRNYQ